MYLLEDIGSLDILLACEWDSISGCGFHLCQCDLSLGICVLALLRHERGNRKPNTDAVAIGCEERLAELLHRSLLVAQCGQSLAGGNVNIADSALVDGWF